MDTKRLIVPMLICFAIIMVWQFMVNRWIEQNRPTTQPLARATAPTSAPAPALAPAPAPATHAAVTPTTAPATQSTPSMTADGTALMPARPTTLPAILKLGEAGAYNTQLHVSTRGGTIESVILKDFPDGSGIGKYTFQSPYDPARPDTAALALRSIEINGSRIELAGAVWSVVERSGDSIRLSLDILNNSEPMVRIFRTFTLSPKAAPNGGYEHSFTQSFLNLSSRAVNLKAIYNGPNQPPREIERGMDLQIISGYNYDRDVAVYSHYLESFDEKTPTQDLTLGDNKYPFLWTGAASVYFNAILLPQSTDPQHPSPKWIARVSGEAVNPASDPYQRLVRTTLQTDDLQLEPGQPVELGHAMFLGPRQRKLLNTAFYENFPRSYDRTLVITSGPCGWCTFQWLINILVGILSFFHMIFRDWGLAIIALVLVVRALLHPITKRSQVSMMKMGKMGPEVERLKKKYGDNKDELNKAMMELYKEQGFTPVLGCLPMFLQMPVWIALWSALQSTFELRQAPFLYGWTWIDDLAKPDQLYAFPRPIPLLLFGWELHAINLLPILMVGVTYLNNKFMPKPAAMTPEQAQQQKMMMWMTMVFPLMFYAFPSGLNLYYVTSMGLGIIESKIIRDHIKRKEEEEKAGKVIVDAPRGMKKKRGDDGPGGAGAKRKTKPAPGFFGRWMADMQAKLEEIKKQAERGGK